MFATFGETREKQVILVSISSTEHGKGQKIQKCSNRLLHFFPQEFYNFIYWVRVVASTSKFSVLLLVYSPSPFLKLSFR